MHGVRRTGFGVSKATSQVSVITPLSKPTNTNMSTPIPIPGPSKKRKRPPVGTQDIQERRDGQDPGDLEIAPSSAPALRVRTQGQELNVM